MDGWKESTLQVRYAAVMHRWCYLCALCVFVCLFATGDPCHAQQPTVPEHVMRTIDEHGGKVYARGVHVDFSDSTKFSDDVFITLRDLPQMEHLQLSRTVGVSDRTCEQIVANFGQQLKRLDLFETPVTDAAVASIATMPNLEFLHLAKTRITSRSLVLLESRTSLMELYIFDSPVEQAAIARLQQALPTYHIFDQNHATNRSLPRLSA